MRFLLLITPLILLLGACARSEAPTPIVIVPGAWDSDAAWQPVAEALRRRGFSVRIVALPTQEGRAPRLGATLSEYATATATAVAEAGGDVVLVGHSRGGAVVAEAAARPGIRVVRLVYLAAYIPRAGESVYALATADTGSALGPHLRPLADGKALTVDPAGYAGVFGAPPPSSMPAEPVAPLGTPVSAAARAIPAVALITTADRVITPAHQRAMAAASGIPTTDLAAGHLPHRSDPEATAAAIARAARP